MEGYKPLHIWFLLTYEGEKMLEALAECQRHGVACRLLNEIRASILFNLLLLKLMYLLIVGKEG